MAKRQDWWVSKRDQTLAGQQVSKGQLIRPTGAVNDHVIFGDNSRWTYRYDGDAPLLCDTDGCAAQFDGDANLQRHRLLVHAPERDAREQAKIAAAQERMEREEAGETIGGHEVVEVKKGPRGPVPYIAPPFG